MKKIILLIAIPSLLFFHAKAQTSYRDIKELKDQTLKVVLAVDGEENPKYGAEIKNAMNAYWTFSKFEFVTFKEYWDAPYGGIYLLNWVLRPTNGTSITEMISIHAKGNKTIHNAYNVFYKDYKSDFTGFVSFIIQKWNNDNTTILANAAELEKQSKDSVSSFLINKNNLEQLKDKKLLIPSGTFMGCHPDSISKFYKYNYEVVSPDVIKKAIVEHNENICFVYVGNAPIQGRSPLAIYETNGVKIFNGMKKKGAFTETFFEPEVFFKELMIAINKKS